MASITRVGNIMIDAYEMLAPRIAAAGMAATLGLRKFSYAVVTLHRPSNVDDPGQLAVLVGQLVACAAHIPLIFPVHPRTRARLEAEGSLARLKAAGIRALEPMGYIDFMSLVVGARLVVTDSGGVQEETSYLGVPCITVRPNTERPVTLSLGTNRLARLEELDSHVAQCLSSPRPPRPSIPLWDGAAARRIVNDIAARFGLACAGRSA